MLRRGGRAATLSLNSSQGSFLWQLTTVPRLGGLRRTTPKEALEAWLAQHGGKLEETSADELRNWEPEPGDTHLAELPGAEPDTGRVRPLRA